MSSVFSDHDEFALPQGAFTTEHFRALGIVPLHERPLLQRQQPSWDVTKQDRPGATFVDCKSVAPGPWGLVVSSPDESTALIRRPETP